MPQAPRKDAQVQRAQDKESKRARGALSCAECRRLKLKCDKTVPCSSCKRRGCSAICPNGSLITGQGTRFVLADTETLHQKIAVMSDRIRQLEDALAILQTTVTGPAGEAHPLLHRDLLKIKSSIELHSASVPGGQDELKVRDDGEVEEDGELQDAFGTLAIRDDGAATFYGRSAGSESLLIGETSTTPPSSAYSLGPDTTHEPSPPPPLYVTTPEYQTSPPPPGAYSGGHHASSNSDSASLHGSVAALASTFPLAASLSHASSSAVSSPSSYGGSNTLISPRHPHRYIDLETIIANFLPSYPEAVSMMQSYLELAPWFFGAVTRQQIEGEIMPLWYEDAHRASTSTNGFPTVASPGAIAKRQRTSHDLALLFVLCCFGALNDGNLPPAPDNVPAEKYYQLTKAALSLDPGGANGADPKSSRNGLLERPPSVATVQTLSLMAIYEGMCSGENSIETTWALMGLAGKLAQSIGLHRDCARWKLTPAEVQKRRALFWELFITDCWQSLATGRLATFSLPFVDCELPSDPDQTIADDGSVVPSFPFWKARFGAECVSAVVQGTLTSRAPKYSIILDLDRKVRDMELPAYAQGSPPQGVGLAQTMSHFMPHNYRELTLLYIHRCFFAHAITSSPMDPIKSQYAPSFLAGYRSACTIISSVKQQFSLFPAQIARFWVLWTHAFSASVMLASVATNSSRSKIAPAALLELKTACELFEQASGYGGRAVKFLPILHRLQKKAQQAYRDANNGIPPGIPNDIFRPTQSNNTKDEMSIFSGKTNTVNTKASTSALKAGPSNSTISISGRTSSSGKDSRASSGSPRQMFTDNPQFANVHPSLVSELHDFHGYIKGQMQNAYRSGEELFAGAPMAIDTVPGNRAVATTSSAQSNNHHQQYVYHQQQQAEQKKEMERMERLERERQETERREIEELERQEVARKQQLQQQLEIQRRYTQQQEMHRQQQTQQQQRQEQYQQQLEAQQLQHQQQQMQHIPQYRQQSYDADGTGYLPISAMVHPNQPHSAPAVPTRSARQHSVPHAAPNAPQAYQTLPPSHQQYPPPPTQVPSSAVPHPTSHPTHHSAQPSHGPVSSSSHPQHSMYTAPPAYHRQAAPDIAHAASSTSYATNYMQSEAPISAGPYAQEQVQESYKYWPAASASFAMPDQQPTTTTYANAAHMPHQHYTPENALRGIAADDPRLQETWQSYMEKVGSPRQFFED